MKVTNFEDRIHVLDSETNVSSVINDIADSDVQEDAFYICDVSDIVNKYKIFKRQMPRVDPHYAVKCNDSPIVLSTLAALGTGFDCASKSEIVKTLNVGVDPSRIIFANPAKQASHIRYANATNVQMMTFDSEAELYKVKKLFPHAKMVLRIRYDAEVAQCPLGIKFGCDPVSEGPHLLDLARSLSIDVIGISFHVGSGCGDPPVFYKAIGAARKLFDYAETLGYKFDLLDIGGGYPGDKGTSLDKIAHHVNRGLEDYFPDPRVKIIAEPGRFFVASAYTLVCNVYANRVVCTAPEKDNDQETKNKHLMYFINDGVYGSFNCMLFEDRVVVPSLLKINSATKYDSSIWGPTCDGIDCIARNIMLPEINIGDWIVFENMGAYTLSAATSFNGFPVPKVHLVADQSTWYFLRDTISLTEDHFVFGNSPANIRLGLDEEMRNSQSWCIPDLPICLSIPHHINGDQMIQEHSLDYANP